VESENKYTIITIPDGKSFLVRCSEFNLILRGDARVEGMIVGIGNTFEEAQTIYRNLTKC
jgi:hypothetical protein